jgi:hypothetical protein
MRNLVVRVGLLVQVLWALSALLPGVVAAEPVSGPRETVDQGFTTTRPGTATGLSYKGTYHAAGDEKGAPPYLPRMVFVYPRGFRFDTSVPDRCSATDPELEVRGPDACPAGSRLGEGTTEGLFMAPITHSFVFDHYTHHLYVVNGANGQIMLIESEGFTVVRGKFQPDGSQVFNSPTCFPSPPAGGCPDNYILQLGSTTSIAPYTKTVGGAVRSYATTPSKCPRRGYWGTTVEFSWSDGSTDSVVSKQPCAP